MDVVKQGYVRVRSKRLSLWKKRWAILRRASSKGPVRLDLYIDERSARNGAIPKTLILSSVSNVCRLSSTVRVHSFAVSLNHNTLSRWFACDSDLEADAWVKLLIQECLLPQPGIATGEPDVLSPGIQKELQEQFHVYLMPNPKLDAFGECLLQVTPENIYLWDVSKLKLKLVSWPLTALRRYGSDPTKFTFEAGRHCATGEGMFVFHTLLGEKIYRKVHQATLAIAEAHHKNKRLLAQITNASSNVSSSSSQSQESQEATTATTTSTTTTNKNNNNNTTNSTSPTCISSSPLVFDSTHIHPNSQGTSISPSPEPLGLPSLSTPTFV